MDWKTLRRDKLARAASYKPAERREGVWWGALDRAGDWWNRFTSLSWWEKGMVIGTGVLLAVLTPMAALALAGGDANESALVPASPTSTVVDAGPSATPSPRPSITPKPLPNTPTPTSTPKPIREDCDELRGADDGSPEEQLWFVDNCELETATPAEPAQDEDPEPDDTETPVPQQPTNTPPPEPSISASRAAALAARWISNNPAFSELAASAGSCIPQALGSGWRVACTGETNGCAGVACELTIWVCVTDTGTRQC